MKYCTKCGQELDDNDKFCKACGASVEAEQKFQVKTKKSDLEKVVVVFMIIATVLQGFAIIPLLWCIPMTIYINNRIKRNEEISLAMKILTLIFVSRVAGICLLILEINGIEK